MERPMRQRACAASIGERAGVAWSLRCALLRFQALGWRAVLYADRLAHLVCPELGRKTARHDCEGTVLEAGAQHLSSGLRRTLGGQTSENLFF
jgi:hypothetical protein